jgi:hypothetical protein
VSTFTANAALFAAIATCGLSAILAAVSFRAYQRFRRHRVLIIGLGFLVFAAKGAYLVWQGLQVGTTELSLVVGMLDLVTLLLLYFAVRIR